MIGINYLLLIGITLIFIGMINFIFYSPFIPVIGLLGVVMAVVGVLLIILSQRLKSGKIYR
ncbi:MAG: hypothetical protein QMD22_06900 [archaeon]|nr:hypothetical protein [archaeon]